MTVDLTTLLLVFIMGMFVGALIAIIGVYRGLTKGKRTLRGYDIVKGAPE